VTRRRGQSLVEFATTAGLVLVILSTVSGLLPGVAYRSAVLTTLQSVTVSAARYVPAPAASAAVRRTTLCTSLLAIARRQLAVVLPTGATIETAGSGCANTTGALPVIASGTGPVLTVKLITDVTPANSTTGSEPYGAGDHIQICMAYSWRPTSGLYLLAPVVGGMVGRKDVAAIAYRFCAPEVVIDANRSQ
jgi:hypothetical protein